MAEVDTSAEAVRKKIADLRKDDARNWEDHRDSANFLESLLARAERAEQSWRCFHCGETFTTREAARDHFGPNAISVPACHLSDAEVLQQLRDSEDSNLRIYRLKEKALADAAAMLAQRDSARAELAKLRAENEWRPIESAPRQSDMQPIDLWCRSYFMNADGTKQLAVEFRVENAVWFDDQWTNSDGNLHDAFEGFNVGDDLFEIVGWRPLPSPPETQT
jgi:hypothetical protein